MFGYTPSISLSQSPIDCSVGGWEYAWPLGWVLNHYLSAKRNYELLSVRKIKNWKRQSVCSSKSCLPHINERKRITFNCQHCGSNHNKYSECMNCEDMCHNPKIFVMSLICKTSSKEICLKSSQSCIQLSPRQPWCNECA